MINLTIRTKKDIIKELDKIAALKKLDRAQLLRQILEKGLEKEKIQIAIELYQQGNSIEYSANLAGINIWDLLDALYTQGIPQKVDLKLEKILLSQAFEKELPELSKKILEL
ncbi:MAG TPA: hypothetical protein VMV49_04450 [Candidatus Deferrimicrobium sp.]|nr:hypothetical protein [Candidatus Deferrimicrobium sp.]